MATATLTRIEDLDVDKAAWDVEYYTESIASLTGQAEKDAFHAAVVAAYQDLHTQPKQPALTYTEKRILTFAARPIRVAGKREAAIRAEFGFGAVKYYQLLNALLDRPEAAAFAPLTVNRLCEIRDARRAARSSAAAGTGTTR